MNNLELFFLYDSHCPWSYASTPILNALHEEYPDMAIHLWHCAHYDGRDSAGLDQVNAVKVQSNVKFSKDYIQSANSPKNGIMMANLMAWIEEKQPAKSLDVLNALQKEHFTNGNALMSKSDFEPVISQFKLSPPGKVFKSELSKDAQYALVDIEELQELIQTTAFPAMVLIVNDNAVLLQHSLYLERPQKIVEAVALELK